MNAYMCTVCGYIYNEQSAEKNIEDVVIDFENLDFSSWQCPNCGVSPDLFEPIDSEQIPDIPVSKK